MPAVPNKIDVQKLLLALRGYKAATGKDSAYILNRAGRNIAFRAASFTPKGSASRIRASLYRDQHLRYALTSLYLRRRGIKKLKPPQFQREVEKLVARRVNSANYLRAMWANAVEDFGGVYKGGKKFKRASGFANKATPQKLLAELAAITSQPNARSKAGAELIATEAVERAVDFVIKDMMQFAKQKFAETARQMSHY